MKEQRFGDIVTPFSSSKAKRQTVRNSLKISILRDYICNVRQIVLLELSSTGHREMALIL